jgi:hypothetical protein
MFLTVCPTVGPALGGNSFKPEVIKKASTAAAPLAQWVTANIEYATVLETVGPMQQELEKLEKNLKKSTKKLEDADAQSGGGLEVPVVLHMPPPGFS